MWDLERIYRVSTSGSAREKIDFDLNELAGSTLKAIKIYVPKETKSDKDGSEKESGGYTSYLTIIPGDVLYKIWGIHCLHNYPSVHLRFQVYCHNIPV